MKLDLDPGLVRPLSSAESEFLQVLVTQFRIRPTGRGLKLTVSFDANSPAIWRRAAKSHLLAKLPDARRRRVQQAIDAYFAKPAGELVNPDPDFPFRLGNGGTLPVARIEGEDYYVLFYRDAHPVGWNIANGGANTVHDLLRPDAIIERELREELIIISPEPERAWRYVFDWHDAHLREHPDFALANHLWSRRFADLNYPTLCDVRLPLKWVPSPDANLGSAFDVNYDSIEVACGSSERRTTWHGILNLNAEDFGIEFDRVAKLAVGPNSIFCDGEVYSGRLLNRVIGLFEVKKTNQRLLGRATVFRPDRIFWDGCDRSADKLETVVSDYLRSLAAETFTDPKANPGAQPADRFGLCPVTRNVIRRYLRLANDGAPPPESLPQHPYDVFLSFASEDRPLASAVHRHLTERAGQQVFFSDVSIGHGLFADQIDRALDVARGFVLVGSRSEHLYKSWVKYEWSQFHNDVLSHRKSEDSPLLAFVPGLKPDDLPRPFRTRQAVFDHREADPRALNQLVGLFNRKRRPHGRRNQPTVKVAGA